MLGYGPEDANFVLELIYNYGVHMYHAGNDLCWWAPCHVHRLSAGQQSAPSGQRWQPGGRAAPGAALSRPRTRPRPQD